MVFSDFWVGRIVKTTLFPKFGGPAQKWDKAGLGKGGAWWNPEPPFSPLTPSPLPFLPFLPPFPWPPPPKAKGKGGGGRGEEGGKWGERGGGLEEGLLGCPPPKIC
jgi:hypothetical protein